MTTTKVRLYSDLHLEFYHPAQYFAPIRSNPGNCDVLVLAGDIINAVDYSKGKGSKQAREAYDNFFADAVRNYDKVLMVMGNHEHYGYNISRSLEKLRSSIPSEITILEKDTFRYNDVDFIGASLWTNFRNGNPFEMLTAATSMNDYSIIRIGNSYKRLRPQDTFSIHEQTMFWMENTLPTLGENVFVITHHAPSFKSVEAEYRTNDMNGAYASELFSFIADKSQIKHWVHGHTHCSNDYYIEQCRVLSNAYGYRNHGTNPSFNPELIIHV
jgi:Icc-related predicted phosphoesterase